MSQTNRPVKKAPKSSACEEVRKLYDNGICKPYEVMNEVLEEVEEAGKNYPPMRSAHEGLSIIREEVLELEQEVFVKQKNRDPLKMRREAIQVAAMAVRFIMDICYGKERL